MQNNHNLEVKKETWLTFDKPERYISLQLIN